MAVAANAVPRGPDSIAAIGARAAGVVPISHAMPDQAERTEADDRGLARPLRPVIVVLGEAFRDRRHRSCRLLLGLRQGRANGSCCAIAAAARHR